MADSGMTPAIDDEAMLADLLNAEGAMDHLEVALTEMAGTAKAMADAAERRGARIDAMLDRIDATIAEIANRLSVPVAA